MQGSELKVEENAPYGATDAGIKGDCVDYLWISADGYVFKWSEVECQWYLFSIDNVYKYYDSLIELNEDKL